MSEKKITDGLRKECIRLRENADNFENVANELDKITVDEFLVIEVGIYRKLHIGYYEGVIDDECGSYSIKLGNFAYSDKFQNNPSLINGEVVIENQKEILPGVSQLVYGSKPKQHQLDHAGEIFYPRIYNKTKIYRGDEAVKVMHSYGISMEDYKSLFLNDLRSIKLK